MHDARETTVLTDDDVREWISANVPAADFHDKRMLLIVPDATRTAPLPLLFGALRSHLGPVAKSLDVLVALGTHPAMPERSTDSHKRGKGTRAHKQREQEGRTSILT